MVLLLQLVVIALSVLIYGGLIYLLLRHRRVLDFTTWPPHPALRRICLVWLVFLVIFAPMAYNRGDMRVWVTSMLNVLDGGTVPQTYVYMPIYAQILAALMLSFKLLNLVNEWTVVYVVHVPVLLAYIYSAKLMSDALPEQRGIAPLAIVIAPVTLFYILFGTNHILMFTLLFASLMALRGNQPFLAGIFAVLSAYKLLLIPTLGVLGVILLVRYGWKTVAPFVLGGVAVLIPSLLYYASDMAYFTRALSNVGAIGFHSTHIEGFHFLYVFREQPGFEAWYIGGKIWFFIILVAMVITAALFLRRYLNSLQALAFITGIIMLAAPEPFRMEPVVGLLWVDAVYRRDLRLQTAVFIMLFAHGASWLMPALPSAVVPIEGAAELWEARGFLLGLALIHLLGATRNRQTRLNLPHLTNLSAQPHHPSIH